MNSFVVRSLPHAQAIGRGLLRKDLLMQISSTGQERA